MINTNVLRKAMHEIAAKRGDFTLFALFGMPDTNGQLECSTRYTECACVFGASAALVNELDGLAYCPEEAKTDLGRNFAVKLNEPWKN